MAGPGLLLLPLDAGDRGSQRCRAGPRALAGLGLGLGAPVRVCVAGGAALCWAWPRRDRADGFLQLDTKCATPGLRGLGLNPSPGLEPGLGLNPSPGLEPGLGLGLGRLEPVSCISLRRVCVRAVLGAPGPGRAAIQRLAAEALRGVLLSPGFVVRLGPEPEAQASPGLLLLEVGSVEPPTAGAGLLSARGAVQVTAVLSPGLGLGLQPGLSLSLSPGLELEPGLSLSPGLGLKPSPGLEPGLSPGLESGRGPLREALGLSLSPGLEPGLGLEPGRGPLREALGLPLRYPRAAARLGLSCPRALLLGPSGVGKSRLARGLARELGAELLQAGPAEIQGPRPGQAEQRLRAVWAEAERRACLLLIDQLDILCPARGDSPPAARLLAQLLILIDRPPPGPLAVIAASSRPEAVDPALRRPGRFDREVTVGVPTTSQRKSILEIITAPMPLSADVNVPWLAEATSGYVAADLTALCREAALQVVRRSSQDSVQKEITFTDFREALKIVLPSSLRSSIGLTDFRPIQWDQIGGLDQVKLKLRQSIEWPMMFPEAFVRMGVMPTRGILLYGPPGCAKTTLVKAAASSCRCSFLSVSGADLFSPFVGDSEKALAQVFRQARAAAPSILFLDEIDSMLGSRSLDATNGRSVHERVLSVLLNEMDGIGQLVTERRGNGRKLLECEGEQSEEQTKKLEFQEVCNKDVIVVAATNRPDLLDDALLRPGRFDQIIFVPSPDKEARLSILRICTSKTPLADVSLEELADETAGFTGADLQNLCKEAALLALQENGLDAAAVNHHHFLKSLQSLKPSLTEQQLEFYRNLFSASDLC